MLGHVGLELAAADHLDQATEDLVVGVRVLPARPRFIGRGLVGELVHETFEFVGVAAVKSQVVV